MWIRTSAAVFLSFTLAVALGGLYTLFGFQSVDENFVWGLLLIVPLWITFAALLYAAESAQRAVVWLLVGNAACYATLALQAPVSL